MPINQNIKLNRNSGIGLIEVMVTVVVLSIGLLGIAALQIMSKHSGFEAIQRSTASMLANDMLERMRANTLALPTTFTFVPGTVSTEPTPICDDSNPCTPAQLLLHDQWDWDQIVRGATETRGGTETGGLVLPTVCVTAPPVTSPGFPTGTYNVAIAWRGQTPLANPTANACGQGTGRYDDDAGNSDLHRRLLVVDVFIDAT